MKLFALFVLLGLAMMPAFSKRAGNVRAPGTFSFNLYRKLQGEGDGVKEDAQEEKKDDAAETADETNGEDETPQEENELSESDRNRPPYPYNLPAFPYMPQFGGSIPYAYGNVYPGAWNYYSFMRGQPIISPLSYYPLPGQTNTRGFY